MVIVTFISFQIRLFSKSAIACCLRQNILFTPVIYIDSVPKQKLLKGVKITLPFMTDIGCTKTPDNIILFYSNVTTEWKDITSETSPKIETDFSVSFHIQHFSRYAIFFYSSKDQGSSLLKTDGLDNATFG